MYAVASTSSYYPVYPESEYTTMPTPGYYTPYNDVTDPLVELYPHTVPSPHFYEVYGDFVVGSTLWEAVEGVFDLTCLFPPVPADLQNSTAPEFEAKPEFSALSQLEHLEDVLVDAPPLPYFYSTYPVDSTQPSMSNWEDNYNDSEAGNVVEDTYQTVYYESATTSSVHNQTISHVYADFEGPQAQLAASGYGYAPAPFHNQYYNTVIEGDGAYPPTGYGTTIAAPIADIGAAMGRSLVPGSAEGISPPLEYQPFPYTNTYRSYNQNDCNPDDSTAGPSTFQVASPQHTGQYLEQAPPHRPNRRTEGPRFNPYARVSNTRVQHTPQLLPLSLAPAYDRLERIECIRKSVLAGNQIKKEQYEGVSFEDIRPYLRQIVDAGGEARYMCPLVGCEMQAKTRQHLKTHMDAKNNHTLEAACENKAYPGDPASFERMIKRSKEKKG
ncbi:hypothetical protein BDN72DRAFT_879504 [Pluteus cervinus]|uniref:Uncharacterized protein n=1 Tax=Pluteus cervinus TaxID=181527 RepID=A0ACD3APM1_9AGAR|nr:hypothetical protein BDN72DRAFT_879504 [Pluteus cervinus]